MKTKSRLGLGVALLALLAGCGTETPSTDNQALANEQNLADNGLIADPEIPNAAAEANGAAAVAPEVEPASTNEPAAVKVAPIPPPAKARADAPKAAPKAAPKPEPSQPPEAECLPEHRAAGHC